jgi:hypothetical protein
MTTNFSGIQTFSGIQPGVTEFPQIQYYYDNVNKQQYIFINSRYYVLIPGIVTATKFALAGNLDCFIEYSIIPNNNHLDIDLFKCSDISGSGRMLMRDLIYYLLSNNLINYQTNISLVPSAHVFYVKRIKPNQQKLEFYYNKLGFDKITNIDENGVKTFSGTVGNILYHIQYYNNTIDISDEEENEFWLGGRRKRSIKKRSIKKRSIKKQSIKKQSIRRKKYN